MSKYNFEYIGEFKLNYSGKQAYKQRKIPEKQSDSLTKEQRRTKYEKEHAD